MPQEKSKVDKVVLALSTFFVLALTPFLYLQLGSRYAQLFLIAVLIGITLMQAGFGFTGAWRLFIVQARGRAIRAQLLLFIFSMVLIYPVIGHAVPSLSGSAALAPVGISVLVGAFLFGIGMQLGGGCGSGTLYTFGQGQVDMLLTLIFFIVGSFVGSIHLPWWLAQASLGEVSLIQSLGWLNGLLIQSAALVLLYGLVLHWENGRHGNVEPLLGKRESAGRAVHWLQGPWPLWWGSVMLAVCGLLTVLVAGHTWSITFAFGLWGAKIWQALGGDLAGFAYWSSGYPKAAVASSVLRDHTSLMNFGIIFGALMASALQNRFAPQSSLHIRRVVTAVLGGLLLGYGARLAFGCNIGALLGGMASGSLHAWLWLVAGFAGNIVGVRLRSVMQSSR